MQKIKLPYICERMRGFTLPVNGEMFVHNDDQIYCVRLADQPAVSPVTGDPFEHEARADIFGITGRSPQLECGSVHISYAFDPRKDTQAIDVKIGDALHAIRFASLSGDWFCATLTPCGTYLVVAEPYALEVYDIEEAVRAQVARKVVTTEPSRQPTVRRRWWQQKRVFKGVRADEQTIKRAEERLNYHLPGSYRTWLREVGYGIGPEGGLMPIEAPRSRPIMRKRLMIAF